MKITKNTTIQEALMLGEESFEVLAKYFGPGCMACGAAAFETLEMACQAHGFDDSKIPEIVSEIQAVADKKEANPKASDSKVQD